MSVLNIQIDDFIGKYSLPSGKFSREALELDIDEYERIYLIGLFGSKMYNSFVADLEAFEPQEQAFKDIYEPLEVETKTGILISDGIRKMVIGFIYWEVCRKTQTKQTNVGLVAKKGELSENQDVLNVVDRYNESVWDFLAIQTYIIENKELVSEYSEFSGGQIKIEGWF